jgi:lysozyme family protein
MSEFDWAFCYTQDNEGWDAESNDPDDRGGYTRYGIAQKFWPEVDVKNLDEEGAKNFYRTRFWDALQLDKLNDPRVAIKVFDTAVNMGNQWGGKMLQMALNDYNDAYGLTVDGRIGPRTIEAANKADGDAVLLFMVNRLIDRYTELANIGNNMKFKKGWITRARRLP